MKISSSFDIRDGRSERKMLTVAAMLVAGAAVELYAVCPSAGGEAACATHCYDQGYSCYIYSCNGSYGMCVCPEHPENYPGSCS